MQRLYVRKVRLCPGSTERVHSLRRLLLLVLRKPAQAVLGRNTARARTTGPVLQRLPKGVLTR